MASCARRCLVPVLAVLCAAGLASGKNTKQELQRDLNDTSLVGDWNYDDIDAGFAKAAKSRRPVCVVFR